MKERGEIFFVGKIGIKDFVYDFNVLINCICLLVILVILICKFKIFLVFFRFVYEDVDL